MKVSDAIKIFGKVGICPECGSDNVGVIDSRDYYITNGVKVDTPLRRRRKCGDCSHRYTTYEITLSDYERYVEAIQEAKRLQVAINSFAGWEPPL